MEHTYEQDLSSLDDCLAALPALLRQLEARLARRGGDLGVGKHFVKLKFHDFVATTAEAPGSRLDLDAYQQLCRTAFERGKRPVRLLGLGVRLREPLAARFRQLSLDLPRPGLGQGVR